MQSIDTGSQVCNIVWSKHSCELVSTHGYSQNQIVVWQYPSLQQVTKLTGHSYRVLYLAMSPDGESIVTGAGDETLRFWRVFSKQRCQRVSKMKFLGGFFAEKCLIRTKILFSGNSFGSKSFYEHSLIMEVLQYAHSTCESR